MPLLLDLCTKKEVIVIGDRGTFTLAFDMQQTFAQLEGEWVLSVSAGVKLGAIQERAHIMHKYCVTNHGQLCAGTFPFHQLEHVQQQAGLAKGT